MQLSVHIHSDQNWSYPGDRLGGSMHEDIIKQTQDFVRYALQNGDSAHDWHHVRRVWVNAKKLAEEEGADTFVVELSALLHDVDDWKSTGGKPGDDPAKTRKFLTSLRLPQEKIDRVCDIIKSIDYVGSMEKRGLENLEAKIVYDADKLDAIGAIGIARVFGFGGSKGLSMFEPDIFPDAEVTTAQYTDIKRKTNTSINHFFEKLLLLKDRLYTASARQEADKRHAFMLEYLQQFFGEQGEKTWLDFLHKF